VLSTPAERRACFLEAVVLTTAQYQQQTASRGMGWVEGGLPATKLQKAREAFVLTLPSSHKTYSRVSKGKEKRKESLEALISDQRNKHLPFFMTFGMFNSYVAGMAKTDWAPVCEGLVSDARTILQLCIYV
jgi:hypothetical protein